MNTLFNGSIFTLIALQLNFALVLSRQLETKDRDGYYTKWKVNSTNLFLGTDKITALDTNKTDIPLSRMQNNSNLMSNKTLKDNRRQENQIAQKAPGTELNASHLNVSKLRSNKERKQRAEPIEVTETSETLSTASYSPMDKMDTSQKPYRSVSAAMKTGESWPWGKTDHHHHKNNHHEDNNLSAESEEKESMSNCGNFISKDRITQLTFFLSFALFNTQRNM